jgi:hypothetical protein
MENNNQYGILKRIKVKAKVNEVTGNISYRTVFSNKNPDGTTFFASMFINFAQEAKNKPVDNDSYIFIKNGFISPREGKDGKTEWNLVILDFDYDESTPSEEPSQEFAPTYSDDDDLPF